MKLVFFSPFLKASAIGRVTALLVRSLYALGHTAVVIRAEQEDLLHSPVHLCEAEVIAWTQADAVNDAIRDADAVIYQIGDNYLYHQGCLHWLPLQPGIVCLHDFFVAHLFMGWAQGRIAEAQEILTQWYGAAAAPEFFASAVNAETFLATASGSYPMTEWICSMASGVISHSNWGMSRVEKACPGPVRVVSLPYDAPGAEPVSNRSFASTARICLLTVGHANQNKRIDSVIRAIGASETLRKHVTYRLCGWIDPSVAATLTALAHSLSVELLISGQLEDADLQMAFKEADVLCSLRWPSLEAASASVIEGLLYGKPIVVTDTGFYSELPNDCVRKISPANEIADLTVVLEQLCDDADARHRLALRGQQWATATFRADHYAARVLEMAQLTAASGPIVTMVSCLLDQLNAWGGTDALLTAEDMARPLEIFERPMIGSPPMNPDFR